MKFKTGDAAVGIFVIAILFLIIIPLPDWLLSIFLIINISLAAMILLSALFSSETLDLSMFPTMLLITTIFRLALNIASTRLILTEADAGAVVQAFGEFVSGGNLIVGTILFIIITIVNFLVITKGSERVAEVSARFALDAMPGKQMAIDADLNSGFIDEATAKTRREKVQQEASFFGTMDGASKFVKNDAVAGLLISFINIVAGLIIGITTKEMEFSQAINTYTILTIGDGLVSAIPALFISAATGILVTKANNIDDIGMTIFTQFGKSPLILYIVSGVLLTLGIMTPMGLTVTAPVAIVLIILARQVTKEIKVKQVDSDINATDVQIEEIRKPENVISLLNVDAVELEFGYGIIPLADVEQGGDLMDRVIMIRRQIALELGTIVPVIRLRDNIQLHPSHYVIKIKGVEVSRGEVMFDHYMALDTGQVTDVIDGIDTIEPSFGLPALWISENNRELAEINGYTVVDCPSIIATHLTEVLKKNLHKLLSRQDVQTLINNVAENHPALVSELVPKLLGLGEIQKVLANLLSEGVSIRDLVTICETLADYASTVKDTDVLTEYVRQSLSRAISKSVFNTGLNRVITLDTEIERMIMDSIQHTDRGSYSAIDPQTLNAIVERLQIEYKKLIGRGIPPIILTSPIVRIYFRQLISQYISDITVISYNEIEPNVEIQSVGMVSI